MKLEIKVPSVGESVSSAEIEAWEKTQGDQVKKGEVLVTLGTDKASLDIPAEQNGALHILKHQGAQVYIDEVIGYIETDSFQKDSPQTESINKNSSPRQNSPVSFKFQNTKENLSPSVKRLVEISHINPSLISGTGKAGRLTKEDVLTARKSNNIKSSLNDPVKENDPLSGGKEETEPLLRKGQRREPMTRLRRATAEKLVRSQHQSATLSTFNEVDLSRIIEIRKNHQGEFIKKYGCKLGFMSFFVKAVVSALKEFPKLNAFIEGDDIIYNDFQHIGIAVSTEKSLVVPVIFNAEQLSLSAIEKKLLEYKDKALSLKLSPDDLLGGTFTISNGGVFGSLLSTPILNPPQSGILGMHKIEERPLAINGKLEIRPMMYLTLSYDHRIVDGRESVGFLVKVKEGLEEPARLLIDI